MENKIREAIEFLATSPYIDMEIRDATKTVCLEVVRLEIRIKELENQLSGKCESLLQTEEAWHEEIALKKDAENHIKELEAARDGFRNGQMQLQLMVNDLIDSNMKWGKRVKELEEECDRLERKMAREH